MRSLWFEFLKGKMAEKRQSVLEQERSLESSPEQWATQKRTRKDGTGTGDLEPLLVNVALSVLIFVQIAYETLIHHLCKRQMDKEVVVHIYNGISLSSKKEQISVSWTEMDEPRGCYGEGNGTPLQYSSL